MVEIGVPLTCCASLHCVHNPPKPSAHYLLLINLTLSEAYRLLLGGSLSALTWSISEQTAGSQRAEDSCSERHQALEVRGAHDN